MISDWGLCVRCGVGLGDTPYGGISPHTSGVGLCGIIRDDPEQSDTSPFLHWMSYSGAYSDRIKPSALIRFWESLYGLASRVCSDSSEAIAAPNVAPDCPEQSRMYVRD